jgi:hypothetical protein
VTKAYGTGSTTPENRKCRAVPKCSVSVVLHVCLTAATAGKGHLEKPIYCSTEGCECKELLGENAAA